jgi:hypothetical protein
MLLYWSFFFSHTSLLLFLVLTHVSPVF